MDDRSVVLDLDRDRYVGLGRSLTRAALRLTGGPDPSRDDERASELETGRAKLVAQGILTTSPPKTLRRTAPSATTSHWPSDPTDDASHRSMDWKAGLSALRALTDAQVSLRTLPFRKTIALVAREKVRPDHARARRTEQDLIDTFYGTRPWFPVKPICRLDAVALCIFLNRNGLDADLVFGVRLDPFHAHCWVQRGEAVLNEAHDGVLKYTPIMVV
ncbi:MAG: lasso peptide biosynthesis B2 protein [Phenylobacterium sp.]|uniref:lasso peptide biosynthesis B2 protein n=1 Tax=Phenylobacterium sp. TaxID=1871053 RepID=UPI002732326D|nr:lasso peptide biosynthesis B2 protein [Phenylobacterium sp.]MDP3749276.1 lasso peptide biosynthesis B2 protein [Phenylobacterium sp.]